MMTNKVRALICGLALGAGSTATAAKGFNYTQADSQVQSSVERDGEQGMLRFYEEYFRASLSPSGESVHTQRMAVRPPIDEMSDNPTGVAARLETQIAEFNPERSIQEQLAGQVPPCPEGERETKPC